MTSPEDIYGTGTCVLAREDLLLERRYVGPSSRGTVRKIGQLFSFIAAVLAATGRDLLNCGSSAVASGISAVDPHFRSLGSVAASTAVGDRECRSICGESRSLLRLSISPPKQRV